MLDPIFAQEYDQPQPTPFGSDYFGRKRSRVREAPVILWLKEYENNPSKFLDYIQDICNCLLFNGPSLYDDDNPNHIGLFDISRGKINSEEYRQFEYAFGDKGTTPIRDNHFFHSAKEHTTSQLINQPFRFGCKNIDNEFAHKKILKDEKTTKKLLRTLFAESMGMDGMNMDFMKDPSINLNGEPAKIMDRLYGQEQLERTIHKLLQNINYDHNILQLAEEAFGYKFDINSEFAYVEVIDGEVRPSIIHPNNVRWIAGSNITDLEHPSVTAASIINYKTINEIINKHKHKLNTGTGSRGLLDAIDKLMENKSNFYYNPERKYFSETYRANTLTSDPTDFNDDKSYRFVNADYMRNIFYPFRKGPYSVGSTILEHEVFFKVQKPRRYVVEINGKTPTESEFKKWRDEIDNRQLIAQFTEIDDEEKRPKGAYVVDKWKEELWHATQLGHRTLINVGPYEFSLKNKKSPNYVGFPIIAQISRKKSAVLLGENINRWCNILYQKIEEILQQAGLSRAIMIDESIISDTDALTTLYNAKKTGILMFNSSRYAGGNGYKGKHFDMLQIGHHLEELERMLAAVGMFNETYNRMVGSSSVVLGAANNYDSTQKTQMNISNQNQLKAGYYFEHNMFMNQLLQRMADIAKKVYAVDDTKYVMLSNGEVQLLKLTKDLNLGDYDIYLESGELALNKSKVIDEALMNAVSSGGIDMLEPLIEALSTDDPNTKLAIFREARDIIRERENQMREQANQQALAMAQLDAKKIQIPLDVQALRNQGGVQIQAMKNSEQREREDAKGAMNDIQASNKTEDMVLQNELSMDQQTHQAGLNPQPQPQLQNSEQ